METDAMIGTKEALVVVQNDAHTTPEARMSVSEATGNFRGAADTTLVVLSARCA